MVFHLAALTDSFWLSPYGPRGALVPLPRRMRYLLPAARDALAPIAAAGAVLTDVFRSMASRRGAGGGKGGGGAAGESGDKFGVGGEGEGWGGGEGG